MVELILQIIILKKSISEFFISRNILKFGKKYFDENKCDLIVWYSPTIFFGSAIYSLKRKYNCKVYLILRDLFPQWAIDTGIIKNKFIIIFLKYYEKFQYDVSDKIGVQSPKNLEYFYKSNLNLEVLYNWTDFRNKFQKVKTNYRKNFNLENKFVIVYGGNIGPAQDVNTFIYLSKKLINFNDIHILLVGDGSEHDYIKNQISINKLTNISLYKSVDQSVFISLLSEFDVGLISLDKKFKTQNYPGKLLAYLEASIPIVACVNEGNDLIGFINSNKIGLASSKNQKDRFLEDVIKIYKKQKIKN